MEKGSKKTEKKSLMNMDLKDLTAGLSRKFRKINNATVIEQKKKVVAFDIGSSNIKIAEGTYYKKKLTVKKCIEIATPEDCIDDGSIVNHEELLSTIDYILKENKIKAKEAICTTNSSLIINRELMIPKVEEDELETYVKYEMQQYLSINLDNYVLQITVLDENPENVEGKMKVRVISFPRKIVNEYYKLLSDLQLKPYVLDVTFNSVNKMLNLAEITHKKENNDDEVTAVIDMGSTSINVNIFINDVLDFTRIIKSGGLELDNALIEKCNCTKSTVLKAKEEKSNLLAIDFDNENEVIKEYTDEWIDKIEKIVKFYKNKNGNIEINKIYIYGETSRINGMDKYIEDKLGIKVQRIDNIDNKNIIINDHDVQIDTYMNVLGSMIRI